MGQLCSIRNDIPVTLHTPGRYGLTTMATSSRWSSVQDVGWFKILQLLQSAVISPMALVLVSKDRDLCHEQLHPTWFEPTAECMSWLVASNLYSGTCQWVNHLVEGLPC